MPLILPSPDSCSDSQRMNPSADIKEAATAAFVERDLMYNGGDETNGHNAHSQLTIFYNGSICVFDSIAPEKAQAIMLIAAATAAATTVASGLNAGFSGSNSGAVVPPEMTRSPSAQILTSLTATLVNSQPQSQPLTHLLPNTSSPICKFQAELPISRRQSLQRFLEKRRERVASRTLYASKTPETPVSEVHDGSPQVSCLNDTAGSC